MQNQTIIFRYDSYSLVYNIKIKKDKVLEFLIYFKKGEMAMYITIKKENTNLKDFLFSKEVQGMIETPHQYANDFTNISFLMKVEDANGTVHVFTKYVNKNKQDKVAIDMSDLNHTVSINHEYKYIIFTNNFMFDVLSELEGIEGYRIINSEDIVGEMKAKYKKTFRTLLDKNISSIRETEEYKKAYTKEIESEDYYRRRIKSDYLEEKEIKSDYSIRFFSNYDPYENGTHIYLQNSDMDLLHAYLSQDNMMEDLATKNFPEDYVVTNIAYVDYHTALENEILSNPDITMKISKIIRKAIEGAGRTLTVKLKSSEELIKVKNDFENGSYFCSTVGCEFIYIENIDEITFRKNVLYKAE